MTVEERHAEALPERQLTDPFEVLGVKAHVPVDVPVALLRQDDRVQQGGQPFSASGGRPEPEREILLAVIPDEVSAQHIIHRPRDSNAELTRH
jgi:hypothetical protein